MWISERSAKRERSAGAISIGRVTIGGKNPAVLVEGELRETELVCPGAVRLPLPGEEVLVLTSGEGDCLVLGGVNPAAGHNAQPGELCLTNGAGGEIRLRADGVIEVSGNLVLRGRLDVEGGLFVNGTPVPGEA